VILSGPASVYAPKNYVWSYDCNAWDPNGDAVVYSLVQAPAGMAIDAGTGFMQWTPASDGAFNVTVRAADAGGASATQSFTVATSSSGIAPVPVICFDRSSLAFGNIDIGRQGIISLTITNCGSGTLSGTMESDQGWLSASPAIFSGNSVPIDVIADNSILNQKQGQHTGNITIHSNGGADVIIPVTLEATCVLTRPNPALLTRRGTQPFITFFGSGIVPNGATTIKIYSLSGELVANLESGIWNKELSEIAWNGLNSSGDPISPGIYIYTYESPREKGVGKFTVVK
jgi:hypothetical protein